MTPCALGRPEECEAECDTASACTSFIIIFFFFLGQGRFEVHAKLNMFVFQKGPPRTCAAFSKKKKKKNNCKHFSGDVS